jgi:hypothetical protein
MTAAEQANRLMAEAIAQRFARQHARVSRLHEAIFELLDHEGPDFVSCVLANISFLVAQPCGAWHERPPSNGLARPGEP